MFSKLRSSLLGCTCIVLCLPFAITGCGGSDDGDAAPTPLQAQATPAPQVVEVKYRVTGVTGALSGTYTDATGATVPIPQSPRSLIWETTVKIPADTMRSKPVNITATTDNQTSITVEIYADGKLIGTQSGVQPTLTVEKH
jgi:hypothetical protein